MRVSIITTFLCCIYLFTFSQVSQVSVVIKSRIKSFEISGDNKYVFVKDENKNEYYFDIQKREFTSGPETVTRSHNYPGNTSNDPSAQKELRKFKPRITHDSIIVENKGGIKHLVYLLTSNEYISKYSNSGKYFLILQKDILHTRGKAGLKVINLETGKVVIDAYSAAKNKILTESVNPGIPPPSSRDPMLGGFPVKYDGTFSRSTNGDTTIWNYKHNGKKGVYKAFIPFQPEFAEFNKDDTWLITTGSEKFMVIDLETGLQRIIKKDGCKLAKFTPDGRVIVSAHGNILSFYDSFKGNLVFTSVDRNNTKGYQESTRNTESSGISEQLNTILEQSGFISPSSERNQGNKYIQIKQSSFNAGNTHLLIGYSEFENNKINSNQINHARNTLYYNILNMNTGKLVGNPAWKDSKIRQASFNPHGNLLLVEYTKSETDLLTMSSTTLVEVFDVRKNKLMYSIPISPILREAEHEYLFSDDGKYIMLANNWRMERVLKLEVYSAADGKRIAASQIPIGYNDSYYSTDIIFLPESDAVVKYHKFRHLVTVYDLSGHTLLKEYKVEPKTNEIPIAVTYDKNYLYIHKSSINNKTPVLAWDLKKRSFSDHKPLAESVVRSSRVLDKSSSYYALYGYDGITIFDKRDTLVSFIRYPSNKIQPKYYDFQVAGDKLYFIDIRADIEYSIITVEKFSDPKNYKIRRIGNDQYRKFKKLTACNPTRNIFTEVNNGDLNFYNLENGKLMYQLRLINDHDYIIWNEKNEYMSSSNQLIKRFKTFEHFEIEKNRPDIILRLMGSNNTELIAKYSSAREERIERTITEGKEEAVQKDMVLSGKPTVVIKLVSDSVTTSQANLVVLLKASDPVHELAKIKVWVKNVPLWSAGGLDISSRKTMELDTTITVRLSDGNNVIEFAAQNKSGTQSDNEYAAITYQSGHVIKPRVNFVGVGISKYNNNKLDNLKFADKDVTDVANLFKQKYPDIAITTFINETATTKNILSAKSNLMSTTEEDIVIFYLSGHGVIDSASGTWRFATYGNNPGPDVNGISFNQLESIIDGIPARKKVLIIDACYSGELPKKLVIKNIPKEFRITSEKNTPDYLLKGDTVQILDSEFEIFDLMFETFSELNKGSGAHVIVSSKGNQQSGEYSELEHGLLTYFLIKRLTDHDKGLKKTSLSVIELRDYIINETIEYSNGKQKPVSRRENLEFNWPIW